MKQKVIKWLKINAIKTIRSVSHSALSVIGASAIISDVDWMMVLSASTLSGIISILTSLEGLSSEEPKEKTSNT